MLEQKNKLRKALGKVISDHSSSLTTSILDLLKGLYKADIIEIGEDFAHFNKEQTILHAHAKTASPESIRKRVLQLNNAFANLNIEATLSSRKKFYALSFDEESLPIGSTQDTLLVERLLADSQTINPDDYQSPEAIVSPRKKKVFVSHKWLPEKLRPLTKEFIKDLDQYIKDSNKDELDITLFCDFLDQGFNHYEPQKTQQDRHCEEADLVLILWSIGYDTSQACQRELSYFLEADGAEKTHKKAIVIMEHGRFQDMPESMTKRILFSHPKDNTQSLIDFWGETKKDERFNDQLQYISSLSDVIKDALTAPLNSSILSKPKQSQGQKIALAARHTIKESNLKDKISEDDLQTPYAFSENTRSSEKRIEVVPRIVDWASAPWEESQTRIAVLLGDFGFGKTISCRLIAQQLGARYEQDANNPIPIYLDLKSLLSAFDQHANQPIEALIETMLTQTGKETISGKDTIEYIRKHHCLIIFDGFDEIGQKLTKSQQQAVYHKLLDVIPADIYRNDTLRIEGKDYDKTLAFRSKILISCRTHFFNRWQEESSFFSGNERHAVSNKNIDRFYMAPFTTKAIQSYLMSALGENEGKKAYKMMGSIHDLSELSAHPIMLKLISKHIPELKRISEQGIKVNSATLYLQLFSEIGQRDVGKHIIRLSSKQQLLAHLAVIMWQKNITTMSYKKLEQWFTEFATSDPLLSKQISITSDQFDLMTSDLCNATLLVRDDEDQFRFAHTSYLEFFRAIGLFETIRKRTLSSYLDTQQANHKNKDKALKLDQETCQFFYNWWQTQDYEDQAEFETGFLHLLESPKSQLEKRISFTLWSFCHCQQVFERQTLENTNGRNKVISFPHSIRLDWSGLSFTENFIPAALSHLSVEKANLENCYFHLVLFEHLNLRKANLTDVNLVQCYIHSSTVMDQSKIKGKGSSQKTTSLPINAFRPPHSSDFFSVAFYPKQFRILSANSDETIKLWDLNTLQCIRSFKGRSGDVNSVDLSNDQSLILSANDDDTINLWDTNTGNCLRTFEGHTSVVTSVSFSHDQSHILSTSDDNTIKLWDTYTGECLHTFEGHYAWISSASFCHDQFRIISASDDKTIKLWDIDTGQCLHTFEGHSDWVNYTTPSNKQSQILSASQDQTIKLWDTKTGQCIRTFEGHSGPVTFVAFSNDESRILSTSDDETIKLWDTSTGHCLRTLEGHSNTIISATFSQDQFHIFSASHDQSIKLWDINTGQCLYTLERYVNTTTAIALSQNKSHIASAGYDQTIKLWDAHSGQCLRTFEGHSGSVTSVAFFHDTKSNQPRIVSASYDKTIKLWNTLNGQCLKTFAGHSDLVTSVVVFRDTKNNQLRIVSASHDKTIKLWDTHNGKCLRTFEGYSSWRNAVDVFHDPKSNRPLIVAASDENSIKLWDTYNGKCLRTFEGHSSSVTSVAVLHDPKSNQPRIISASFDKTIKLWSTYNGQCLRTFEGHSGWVNTVAVFHDPKSNQPCIVSASDDNTIKLWDTHNGQCLQTLRGHSEAVNSVALSHDQTQIISASVDSTIKIWDIQAGQCLKTITQTKRGYFVTDLNASGVEELTFAKGDAWRFLEAKSADGQTFPPWKADNWEEIYQL